MYEDNIEYAATRLVGTYIQHKGKVLYVQKVRTDEGGIPTAYYTDRKADGKVALKELSHTPIPLGYIPKTDVHMFLERLPRRRWKQGIHPENTGCYDSLGLLRDFPTISFFQHLLEQAYESKEVCMICGGAFSPSFFICKKTKQLYYKAERVGEVVNQRLVLDKGKEYLYRRLEKTQ